MFRFTGPCPLTQNGNESLATLKILRADHDCANELECYSTLGASPNHHPGQACIMMLKDHFTIAGPNGRHLCLVYEVMGPSVSSVLREPISFDKNAHLTLSCARRVIYQVLSGLDAIHSQGLVHGDIHAGNVLFTLEDLSKAPLDSLKQPLEDVSVPVKRLVGDPRPGDPRHLTEVRPLNQFLSPVGEVKLADLGNSFSGHRPASQAEMPLEVRSPEMLIDGDVSLTHDCWAFACFVYYALTKNELFQLAFICDNDARDDTHLIQMFSLLGRLPTKFKQSWSRYGTYFDEDGGMTNFDVDDDFPFSDELEDDSEEARTSSEPNDVDLQNDTVTEKVNKETSIPPLRHTGSSNGRFAPDRYPLIVKMFKREVYKDQDDPKTVAEFTARNPPLRPRLMSEKHPDMQSDEAELVLDMLKGLLVYDPDQRVSTKELLQHDWIKKYCIPEARRYNLSPREAENMSGRKRKRAATDIESHLNGMGD